MFEYFRCSNGKNVHKSMRGMHFKEDEIWKMLEEPVKDVSLTESFADQVWEEFQKIHLEFKRQKKFEMEGFREGLKKLEFAEDQLYDDLRNGILDDVAYKRQLDRIRSDRARFVDLLEKADSEIYDAVLDVANSAITLCKDAESRYKSLSPQHRLDLLSRLLSHRALQGGENRKLKYSLRIEVSGIAEARRAEAENKDWRPNANWKRPSFPRPQTLELTNIIEFPFVQSHRSESFLRQKYLEEGLSPLEIGNLCFSSKRTILNWFDEFKIPLRPADVPLRRGLRFGERRVRGQIAGNAGQIKTLHKMRELREKGYSYPQIVEVLNSLKIRAMNGGKWHLKTVYEVLNAKRDSDQPIK